jgi:hypothetical protein
MALTGLPKRTILYGTVQINPSHVPGLSTNWRYGKRTPHPNPYNTKSREIRGFHNILDLIKEGTLFKTTAWTELPLS